jgi:hypothetical protein
MVLETRRDLCQDNAAAAAHRGRSPGGASDGALELTDNEVRLS